MHINEKIRQARALKGWSQKEIADKLEESRSTYAEWERETIPSFDIMVKIAAATGISILEFVAAVDENVARGAHSDEKPALVQKPSADFLAGKLESKEETIQQIDARRADAEATAKKMEQHYNDAKSEKDRLLKTLDKNQDLLEKAQNAIIEVLKPIQEKTEEILSNSNTTLERLSLVETIVRSDDTVIMNNQDLLNGNEVGTSAIEAGSRQIAADKMRKGKGSQAGAHKPRR